MVRLKERIEEDIGFARDEMRKLDQELALRLYLPPDVDRNDAIKKARNAIANIVNNRSMEAQAVVDDMPLLRIAAYLDSVLERWP